VADADLLAEADEAFRANEGIGDGVGPIFNQNACGDYHTEGAIGSPSVQIERRFGRVTNGIFNGEANRGGSLRQLFTVANFNNPNLPAGSRGRCNAADHALFAVATCTTPNVPAGGRGRCTAANPTLCCVPLEQEPSDATVHNVGRLT